MHGTTFKTLRNGIDVVTVWDDGAHHGRCGVVQSTEGPGRRGKGQIKIRFADGTETTARYDKVALGDNTRGD